MRPNQEGFERRLGAVRNIVGQYGLAPTRITPIAYVEHCPFMFNNYIFKVDLASPAVPASFPQKQPCTTPPVATGAASLIVRMSNPLAEGLNNANRVENDVASSYLIRQSLGNVGLESLVPAVYAWARCRFPKIADESGFGWTISEFKTGSDLDGQFPSLSLDEAKGVLDQLADIFTAVQRTKMPPLATKFGALTINTNGDISNGQMPLLPGEPWDTYVDLWVAKLQAKLAESEQSSLLKGWGDGSVRDRIELFVKSDGVGKLLEPVDTNQRILNHGDLTLNNILYDGESKRITGLLDFDWAAVTHPCDEFLFGLWDIGGGIHERVGKIQPNVLSGDFGQQPDNLSEDEVRQWEIAKYWDAALAQKGAIRPSSIAGVERIAALRDFEELLSPFALSSEVMLKRSSEEQKMAKKKETEALIVTWLDKWVGK
ncbi:hypothetical protein HJFPF1_13461 [Paramyrothecium foliicola]|nr:hypothetical protein HJFPF1_13461 [Paramyrothecium foliicola]